MQPFIPATPQQAASPCSTSTPEQLVIRMVEDGAVLGLICICLEIRESSPFQKLLGDLDILRNVRNVVHSYLMSTSVNPVISGSVSVNLSFIMGCEFQPHCLSSHLSSHASCHDFYFVRCWLFFTSVLGHISVVWR